jgi:hypothetical protein
MKWLLFLLGLVGAAMFLKSEVPAIQRYIKIERM